MKQYYQFMLREVLDDLQKIDCNIDSFEEDLHKMLMVSFEKDRSNKCITLNTANRNLLSFLDVVAPPLFFLSLLWHNFIVLIDL